MTCRTKCKYSKWFWNFPKEVTSNVSLCSLCLFYLKNYGIMSSKAFEYYYLELWYNFFSNQYKLAYFRTLKFLIFEQITPLILNIKLYVILLIGFLILLLVLVSLVVGTFGLTGRTSELGMTMSFSWVILSAWVSGF